MQAQQEENYTCAEKVHVLRRRAKCACVVHAAGCTSDRSARFICEDKKPRFHFVPLAASFIFEKTYVRGQLVITARVGLPDCVSQTEAHPAVSVLGLLLWACLDKTRHRLHICTLRPRVNMKQSLKRRDKGQQDLVFMRIIVQPNDPWKAPLSSAFPCRLGQQTFGAAARCVCAFCYIGLQEQKLTSARARRQEGAGNGTGEAEWPALQYPEWWGSSELLTTSTEGREKRRGVWTELCLKLRKLQILLTLSGHSSFPANHWFIKSKRVNGCLLYPPICSRQSNIYCTHTALPLLVTLASSILDPPRSWNVMKTLLLSTISLNFPFVLCFKAPVILLWNLKWMERPSTKVRWFIRTSTPPGTRLSPSPWKISTRKCTSR